MGGLLKSLWHKLYVLTWGTGRFWCIIDEIMISSCSFVAFALAMEDPPVARLHVGIGSSYYLHLPLSSSALGIVFISMCSGFAYV